MKVLILMKSGSDDQSFPAHWLVQHCCLKLKCRADEVELAPAQEKVNKRGDCIFYVTLPDHSTSPWEWFAEGGYEVPYPIGTLMYFRIL